MISTHTSIYFTGELIQIRSLMIYHEKGKVSIYFALYLLFLFYI